MDTTIRPRYPTGSTLYTQIERGNAIWNGTDVVVLATADWASYAVATPESPAGSGRYVAQFPVSVAPGNYTWVVFEQAGASPAVTDRAIGSGGGYWDGTTLSIGGSAVDTEAVADALLVRDWSAIAGTVPAHCVLQALRAVRNRWAVVGGVLKVADETGSLASPAWTADVTVGRNGGVSGIKPRA